MNKGTSYTITFDAFDTSTGALKSGLTDLTVTLSKNGAAYVSASGAVSEIGSTGTYKITLTASETNYDNVTLLASSGTSGVVAPPVHLTFLPAPLTVAQLQSGLATSSLVNSLQTHGDSAWATATGFPTASDITTSVWSNASRTLTASPTDLTTLQTTANSIKAKTDLIPASPAAVGSAMTLTSAYDAAKTAAQASDVQVTVNADGIVVPTASEVSAAVWASSTRTLTSSPTDLSGIASSLSTLQSSVNNLPTSVQIADAVCDETLSGHTSSGTLGKVVQDTATATAATAISSTVSQIQTAVTTINSNVQAISGYTDELEGMVQNLPTSSGIADSVWASPTRTLTASPTDLTALQTTANSIKAKTDLIPSNPASVGSAMTLTTAYDSAKTAAQASDLQVTIDSTDISVPSASEISTAVWSEVSRTLTASPTDITSLQTLLNTIFSMLGHWSVINNTMTVYGSNDTALLTLTLEKDANGFITGIH